MIGWFVSWPNRKHGAPDGLSWCGYGEIVQVIPGWLIVRVIEPVIDAEPEYHQALSLDDGALRYFPTLDAYQAWITYWRRAETNDDMADDDPRAVDDPEAWSSPHKGGRA